jgi:hypothetical protein
VADGALRGALIVMMDTLQAAHDGADWLVVVSKSGSILIVARYGKRMWPEAQLYSTTVII